MDAQIVVHEARDADARRAGGALSDLSRALPFALKFGLGQQLTWQSILAGSFDWRESLQHEAPMRVKLVGPKQPETRFAIFFA